MCSYNRVNNSYASQNSKILNGLLKDELGFEGFVVSDWGAQRMSCLSVQSTVLITNRYWLVICRSRLGCCYAKLGVLGGKF